MSGTVGMKKDVQKIQEHTNLNSQINQDSTQMKINEVSPKIIEGSYSIKIKERIQPEPHQVLIQKSHSLTVEHV